MAGKTLILLASISAINIDASIVYNTYEEKQPSSATSPQQHKSVLNGLDNNEIGRYWDQIKNLFNNISLIIDNHIIENDGRKVNNTDNDNGPHTNEVNDDDDGNNQNDLDDGNDWNDVINESEVEDLNNHRGDIGDYNENYLNDDLKCTLTALPPHPDSGCCGIDISSNNRIVGGEPTLLNQYPWLALIEYKMKYSGRIAPRCGGSLISGRYVLTAAHCATGEVLDDSSIHGVVLGDYDKYHKGPDCVTTNGVQQCIDEAVRIPVEKAIPHVMFNEKKMTNDIALLRLAGSAPYTDAIRPICLPALDLAASTQRGLWLYIAGWGTMKQRLVGEDEYKGVTSNIKRHLAVPYVPLNKCEPWISLLGSKQICAGGLAGQDSCMGDSGGPLMHESDGLYQISGVVSFGAGDPCGKAGVPGVYTNVYKYKDWIYAHIKQ